MSTSNASNASAIPTGPASLAPLALRTGQMLRMDRMYRLQRHIYDLTRKYYLLGRDTLLARMKLRPGQAVLEAGCGTGRNLAILARRHPQVRFFGLDASGEMLKSAAATLARKGLTDRVVLRQALAEELDPQRLFGIHGPFDVIFFSYALSMIPTWDAALRAAMTHVGPHGRLYVVDFHDQMGWPGPVRWSLRRWLALFGVHSRAEIRHYLSQLADQSRRTLSMESLYGRYAFMAEMGAQREARPPFMEEPRFS